MRATKHRGIVIASALYVLLLIPHQAAAQSPSGSIAGNVKDTSGAAVPGVTVEAASPALIEKVRTAVTDGQGNYKITELRPGVYSVTFTLSGFSVVKREGIELSGSFSAPVNAELKVGSVAETITVTGAPPVVDVQSVRTQAVLKAETLEALPSAQKDTVALASLTLGAVPSSAGRNDVGGDRGERSTGISIHGTRGDDGKLNYDGMNTNVFYGGGGGQQRTYKFNTVMVAETVVDTGGNAPDTETGGGNVNMVPKDGGNRFSLFGNANYTSKGLASGKVPDDLIARGSTPDQNSMKQVWDYGLGVGGPLVKDKLWFYTGHRIWGSQSYVADNYFNKSTNFYTYVPDLSRPAYVDIWTRDFGGRLTWQITSKQKLSFEEHYQQSCGCWEGLGATSAPEGTPAFLYTPHYMTQSTWTYPVTNRLLLEAGFSSMRAQVQFLSKGGVNVPGRLTVTDFNLPGVGFYSWGGVAQQFFPVIFDDGDPQRQDNLNWRFATSYVTGSHALKIGAQGLRGTFDTRGHARGGDGSELGYSLNFFSGFPIQVVQYASPFMADGRINSQALYGSDQWTIRKLTLNLGVRYDHFNAGTLPIDVPAGPFIGARHYDAYNDIPNYHDITWRVGAAYDVFGDGKTAIRGSFGRYVVGMGGQQLLSLAPSNAIITTATRTWFDANGNHSPDCDLKNFDANGECGPINTAGFGSPARAFTWDDNARQGWGKREYSNQLSVSLQHELRAGFAVAAGFYHTAFHNTQIAVNTALTASSFNTYCVTAPTDPRLGAASGTQVCGITDQTFAAKAIVPNTVWYRVEDAPIPGLSGERTEAYNGGDVSLNWRFRRSGLLSGGLSLGKQVIDTCFANAFPQITGTVSAGSVATIGVGAGATGVGIRNSNYCTNAAQSLWNGVGSQVKFQVVYPLPYEFVVAATYKNLPGVPEAGTVTYTNDAVAPALGRNLSTCAAATGACTQTVNIDVVQPGTLFDQRLNQVDFRGTRSFRIGRTRLQGVAELYNAFNTRVSQANTTTWGTVAAAGVATPGTTYLRPSLFLGGRLFKFGAQVNF
ncbi:MAG TPA: TonB-dependent receptor [Vicinamibacterales bacterium]|jgi:hypothetical protein|nr:TonB-dependent receptor [Vicinamibacterales bacterium]